MAIMVPAYQYIGQSHEFCLPYPARNFTGWTQLDIPVQPEETALIVMHAWTAPPLEEAEGYYRLIEYIHRARKIMDERFPSYLEAARKKGIRIIHVGSGGEKSLRTLPGFQRVNAKYPEYTYPRIQQSEASQALWDQHWKIGHCDDTNADGFAKAMKQMDFYIKPLDHEDVVCSANQLYGLCCEHNIKHLIYSGFCINWCLMHAPCGLVDMNRHGLMCSAVGDLTTAVENKESTDTEYHLRYGLWQFGSINGYVFLSEDLKNTLLK